MSVVIPCFNQGNFLPAAVTSVQSQGVEDWECIIIDDGSSDETALIAERLASDDPRVRVHHQRNRGLSHSRNIGIGLARGRFVQLLDADDVILPSKFEQQLRAVSALPGPALSYCDYRLRREDGVVLDDGGYLPPHPGTDEGVLHDLIVRWELELSIPVHCFLLDRRLLSGVSGPFDAALANHEDWHCWVRIFAGRPSVVFVDEVLALYTARVGSMSRDIDAMRRGFIAAIDDLLAADNEPAVTDALLEKRDRTVKHYDQLLSEDRGGSSLPRRVVGRIRAMLARADRIG